MRCRNCGTEFDRQDGQCPWCGTKVMFGAKKQPQVQKKVDPWDRPAAKQKDSWEMSISNREWNHSGKCGNETHHNMREMRQQQYDNVSAPYNGKAVLGFVISLFTIWFNFGILSIVSLVMCSKAKKTIRLTGEKGHGLAVAGQIISWITLILFIVSVVAVIFFVWMAYEVESGYGF